MKKAKMLYISPAPYAGPGIAGTARVRDLVNVFTILGFDVHVIAYAMYSDRLGIEHARVHDSLETTTIHVPNRLPKLFKGLAVIPLSWYALKALRSADIIFSDYIAVLTALPAAVLKRLSKKPLILDCMDSATVNRADLLGKDLYAKEADLVFAISPFIGEILTKKHANVLYVPIFIDTALFSFRPDDRARIRSELQLADNEIVVGYAGSFWKIEGIPVLMQAVKDLSTHTQYSTLRLAIIGSQDYGPHYDNVRELIETSGLAGKVLLIPRQPREEMPGYFSACDILCCPKIDCEVNRAANPVKVPEYLAMGIPTVCSRVGGIGNMVRDRESGFLVGPGNVRELSDAIAWIIGHPEEARRMGEHACIAMEKEYSYEANTNRIREGLVRYHMIPDRPGTGGSG
jgi:glycosyltransferase involved in cell wall biosynthesis